MTNEALLQIRDLYKSYGSKIIFEGANVTITEKQKIGVIGRNGAGKSTLFKMIIGDEELDRGFIELMPRLRLGYIPQVDPFDPSETIIGFLERYTKKPQWECAKVAGQFQLKGEMLTNAIGDLSGGYQMRVKLASTLLFDPNLLLLDEPTNYLDLSTLILLEQFLQSFRGGFLCITHDREFIKKTCTSTMEVEHGQIVLHPEPLEEYLEFKAEQVRLAQTVNKNVELKQKQLQTFVSRFGAKASMAKSAQSKLKQITKLESKKIGIANPLSTVKMIIPSVVNRGGSGLMLTKLDIGYPDKLVASNINLELEKGKKVAILGDNGQGKSTLLKTIAGEIDPKNGNYKWTNGLKVAYYAQHVNLALENEETVEEYLKRVADGSVTNDQVYRMMGNFLFKNEESRKRIGVMSGGEKARLCLAGMFLSLSDVLLLDEPTNHLDFETVEAMGEALGNFNGTVVVVSHDRTFVNLLANEIWEVKNGQVKRVLGTYEDYVWEKEQEAQNFTQSLKKESNDSIIADPYEQNITKPAKVLDKQQRVRLYELNKELDKINRKLQTLTQKLLSSPNDNKIINEKEELENKWLQLTTEIDKINE
jgi:ATP-binding cassette, subfamily F, member 3